MTLSAVVSAFLASLDSWWCLGALRRKYTSLVERDRSIANAPLGLVSPVDCRVVSNGVVSSATMDIGRLLGALEDDGATHTVYHYAVLGLSPGGCHRFCSPCQVTFGMGRYFPGASTPLRNWLLRRVLDVKERLVLSGVWLFGRLHLVVEAATAGDLFLSPDGAVKRDEDLRPAFRAFEPGEEVGGFRQGSSMVLVFQAPPEDFKWCASPGEVVRMGQVLGEVVIVSRDEETPSEAKKRRLR